MVLEKTEVRELQPPFEVPILPVGNLLSHDSASFHQKRRLKLGSFAILPDSLIVLILDTIATTLTPAQALTAARALCNFSEASTFTHAISSDDDLWRRIAFSLYPIPKICSASFLKSWRATTLRLLSSSSSSSSTTLTSTSTDTEKSTAVIPQPKPFYSDILFHKRRCRLGDIDEAWLQYDDVLRVSAESLSVEHFQKMYEAPRRPVILTDIVKQWKASEEWDIEKLKHKLGDVQFNAGGYSFTFSQYMEYSEKINEYDDQSLYIFDKLFSEKASFLTADYDVPKYFQEDLFSVVGKDKRPDFRWLIIGPKRSGSSFHKDPNATSAWNAIVKGKKKWVFFPPHVTPPGISPTKDGSDVTTPLSVIEWFINYYDRDFIEEYGGLEATHHPGEIMFIPRGWWHCVLNLDFSIAITQNFVSSVNVDAVVQWLRHHPSQVSGCKSKQHADYLIKMFPSLVVDQFPHLRNRLSFAVDLDEDQNTNSNMITSSTKKRKVSSSSLWQSLQTKSKSSVHVSTEEKCPASQQFSFGFLS